MFQFITENFMGASIVVILRSGAVFSGEVIGIHNELISLKKGAVTVYINANSIDAFY